jgi:hypothetical protein
VIDASVALKLVVPDPPRGKCWALVNDLVSEGFGAIDLPWVRRVGEEGRHSSQVRAA